MKPQTTLAFAAVFLAVLGVFAYLQFTHRETTEQRAQHQARVIPDLANVLPEHVTEVTLKRDHEEFSFTHDADNDQWQMTKPLDVLADASAIRGIVNDLKNLDRMTLSGSKDDKGYGLFSVKTKTDLIQYNLDEPKKSVSITYKTREGKGPTATTSLQVGGTAAGDEGMYVKLPDEDVVFVVRKTGLASLDKKLAEYREPKLISTNRWNADRMALAWPDRKLTTEKADGKWRLVEPIADRGDRTKIEELLGKIVDLKADNRDTDFVDDNATDLAKYGLDQPALVAEVRKEKSSSASSDDKSKAKDKDKDKDKPQVVQKLLIGKTVEGKEDKVYAMLDGQKYVVAVNASVLKDVDKQPSDLRSHDLVEITQADVDYVQIDRPAGTIAIGKKDFDWDIYQPKSTRAETNAVTEFVKKIDDIEITEFIDQGEAKDYGLDQPSVTISIYQKGLKPDETDKDKSKKDDKKKDEKKEEKSDTPPEPKGEPVKVLFGKRDEEKKLVYAQRGGEPGIFAVSDEGLWDLLDRDYLAYRRKQMLSFIEPDVAKISLLRDGTSFTLERKKEKEGDTREVWRMTEPVEAPADSIGVSDMLFDFARLNAKKFVAEGAADLKPYGLDEPKIRATVTMKSEPDKKADQHVLLIGSEIEGDGGHYAKLGDGDLIFAVEQRTVNYLRGELHDRTLIKFDSFKVEGITLTWPDAKLELANQKPEGKTVKEWTVVGDDSFKIDVTKISSLVTFLALLNTDNFVQYQGDFTEDQGLANPALLIEVRVEGESTPKTLRIGAAAEGEKRYVTTAEKSGPVASLPEDRFKDLLAGPKYFAAPEEKKPEPEKPEPAKPEEGKKEESKPEADKKEDKKSEDNKDDKEGSNKEPTKPDEKKPESKSDGSAPEAKKEQPSEPEK